MRHTVHERTGVNERQRNRYNDEREVGDPREGDAERENERHAHAKRESATET